MRAHTTDLMQGFRFHVTADMDGEAVTDPLQKNIDRGEGFQAEAGFQSSTLPEITLEPVEYREGTMEWTQKYLGPPTISDVTFMRGIAKGDTAFIEWIFAAAKGGAYRADITIHHYQRAEFDSTIGSAITDSDRRTLLFQAVPTRVKPAADFDSTSGDVSLAEIDVALEYFDIKIKEKTILDNI